MFFYTRLMILAQGDYKKKHHKRVVIMDKITHYMLWQFLVEDSIYGKADIAKEICEELVKNHKLLIEVYYEDDLELVLGEDENNYIKIELLFCPEYYKVINERKWMMIGMQDDCDDSEASEPESIEKAHGFWQEIFLDLAIQLKLISYTEKPIYLDYSTDPFTYEMLQASSPICFEKNDVENLFEQLSLPFLANLFDEKEINTRTLFDEMDKRTAWQLDYTLYNLRQKMEVVQSNLEKQKFTASMIIFTHERVVYLNFECEECHCRLNDGHYHLKHLFENPHKELSARGLATNFEVGETTYNEDKKEMTLENGIEVADGKKIEEMQNRRDKIEEELNEFRSKQTLQEEDETKIENLESEKDGIEREFGRILNIHGRPKKTTSASTKSHSDRVSKNIDNCINNLPHNLSPLYYHIKDRTILKRGKYFVYTPPDGIKWKVEIK